MEFFKIRKDIPFMRHALVFNVISLITFLLAVGFLATKGLNFGVDFTGGTVLEVHFPEPADLQQVRGALDEAGYKDVTVQNFGTSHDILIRLPSKIKNGADVEGAGAHLSEAVMRDLQRANPAAELRRTEFVGPQVGQELVEGGGLALIAVCFGIVIYLWIRFEWKFGLAAIIANMHDVVIILGFFAFFQWDFSLTVLAAVLAILGYSVNESVVVFDRIRENFRKLRGMSTPEIIDNAITRTLSRTIITHASTQMAVLAMLFFGGETLHYFALALTIGILFGIYSSVLVASPIVMWLGVSRADLMPVKKEGAERQDSTP